MPNRILQRAALAAIALGLSAGCAALSSSNSFSESSGSVSSISDSVSDSSTSSSGSSSGGDDGAALERDVGTYASLYAESGGDPEAFTRGIGTLCERYGVIDWQRNPSVQNGIAQGLALSQLSDASVGALVAHIAGNDDELRERLWAAIVALREGPPVATLR